MQTCTTTINSKYIHINNSVYIINSYLNSNNDIYNFTIKDELNEIVNQLLTKEYQVIFFSVYIYNINQTLAVIKQLKTKSNATIVVGGPEVSYDFEYLFKHGIDYVYRGDVDWSINEIINNQIISSHIVSANNTSSPVNKTGLPAINYLQHINPKPEQILYLETSKGCPYQCSYCMSSLEDKLYDYDLTTVYKMIDYAITKQIKNVKFLDRTFNINVLRAITIIKYLLANSHKDQTFQFEISPELLTTEFLTYLQTINTKQIRFEIGIQSIYKQTINAVMRYQTYEVIAAKIATLINHTNIVTHLDLIAGLPYETYLLFIESFNQTFKLQPDEYQLGILKMLKGTLLTSQQELYEINYHPAAPYEIISNKFLSKQELNVIKAVENIVDRYYNSQLFKQTFTSLVNDFTNYFVLLLNFTKYLANKEIILLDYQLHDLYKWFYDYLDTINYYNKDLVIVDYLTNTKFKPKKFYNTLSKQERSKILQNFVNPSNSLNYLHKYYLVEKLRINNIETLIIKDIKTNLVTKKELNALFLYLVINLERLLDNYRHTPCVMNY